MLPLFFCGPNYCRFSAAFVPWLVRLVMQAILVRNADAIGRKRNEGQCRQSSHDENPNFVEVQRIAAMRIENYQVRARFVRPEPNKIDTMDHFDSPALLLFDSSQEPSVTQKENCLDHSFADCCVSITEHDTVSRFGPLSE
jgi:hypothetical protein